MAHIVMIGIKSICNKMFSSLILTAFNKFFCVIRILFPDIFKKRLSWGTALGYCSELVIKDTLCLVEFTVLSEPLLILMQFEFDHYWIVKSLAESHWIVIKQFIKVWNLKDLKQTCNATSIPSIQSYYQIFVFIN